MREIVPRTLVGRWDSSFVDQKGGFWTIEEFSSIWTAESKDYDSGILTANSKDDLKNQIIEYVKWNNPKTNSSGTRAIASDTSPPNETQKSSNNTILIVTGLLAAGAILYAIRSDVSSQKEWMERYGGLGGRRSASYRR